MSGTVNPGWSKAKYAVRGVHLDQDTAGRLLEGVGDHARREMIVRATMWSDRTRLIDRLPLMRTTFDDPIGGCSFTREFTDAIQ
jgi:hypothetical protein